MFIGHYAVGFAARPLTKKLSLGWLFFAVQWADLLWPFLVFFGIERFVIDPGNTAVTPLNFEHYPWSHSLLMSLIWALVFAGIVYLVTKQKRDTLIGGIAVFSHWFLDWLTHRPDLPIAPGVESFMGLGLWNIFAAAVILEIFLYGGAIYYYLKHTQARNKTGTWAFWGLALVLFFIYIANIFGPPPPSVEMVNISTFGLWLFVAWAFWVDRNRVARIKHT